VDFHELRQGFSPTKQNSGNSRRGCFGGYGIYGKVNMKRKSNKPTRYKFSEIASRLTGISISVFGVSWQPSKPERIIVRSLFIFLEDRRALYTPFAFEMEHQVTESVLQIRETLTQVIQQLPEKSEAISYLKAMRAACREYLDSSNDPSETGWRHNGFLAHLGRLRTIFGYHIAHLAVLYGFDVEGELANILPPEYKEDLKS
jgi:uncharacterized protein DUF6650